MDKNINYRNERLENGTLYVDEVLTTYETIYVKRNENDQKGYPQKEVLEEAVTTLEFPLKQVTASEVKQYRRDGIPSFVLKINDTLFLTTIPKQLSLLNSKILGYHQCAAPFSPICKHLSFASDEDGGCPKVREGSKRIENYPWITIGYEVFNNVHASFRVVKCSHYEKKDPPPTYSAEEIRVARLTVAQHFWPDVTTVQEIRERKNKARSKNE